MVTFHVSLSCFIGDIFVFKHHKIKIRHLKKERNICRILLYFFKKKFLLLISSAYLRSIL